MANKKNKNKRKTNMEVVETQLFNVKNEVKDNTFIFNGPMTIADFANKIGISGSDIVKNYFLKGKMYGLNHILSEDDIAELSFAHNLDFQVVHEINATNYLDSIEFFDSEEEMQSRAPIITIVGHVDHGKTTLIDQIRKSKIVDTEASGITQHTGAYQIEYNGKPITFLDTPGHEAFTAMRARGTDLTDLVVLVVAADDGVMPQTKEAIQHIKAANVPMIVFVNKMDKPVKDLDRLKSELAANDVVIEEYGGTVPIVYGSALQNQGIDDLFDVINLTTEILDLKANYNRYPLGVIVETRMLKGAGIAATVIVKNGTLNIGDYIVAGAHAAKIKTMINSELKPVKQAIPGMPVRITGFNSTPPAGEKFIGFENEKFAKKLASENERLTKKEKFVQQSSTMNIVTDSNTVNIIIKSDTEGTAEALKHSIVNLSNNDITFNVIAASIGNVSNADLLLAQASEAKIFGFNVTAQNSIKNDAKEKNIPMKFYKVIYEILEELQTIVEQNSEPIYELEKTGQAQILKIFHYSKVGNIAGCKMESGFVKTDSFVKVMRRSKLIYEGKIDSLKRGLDDTKEVKNGFEFGTHIENYDDIQEGDLLDFFVKVRKK
ncbi:translation initiation factor IF-2 [Mycoplasma testudineum]|uniref:Translation initiation factor IF-2 n=1 Tax=Mycoplasma testudineum TaxID=244584 RepID=A0A4R6IHC6_9MOLU|nr:translation initiation factor IF-2 [Mycoplasma testudineum]OYD26916.1 translation initiation factor IF-2 [Mycoplasma testudineum]TDO20465.1 translation initiation factor IF-2 [Mycoplasma testudineum]